MTGKELQTTLRKIKNERRGGAPHDVWVSRNRGILLMQVRNTTDVSSKPGLGESMRHLFAIFVPAEGVMMVARAVGVFLLVIGTVVGGGFASAQVYSDATPGQMMYKMKLAVEAAQLFLAPNDEYRTRLHSEFADHRLDEAAQLAEESSDRQALVPGVLAAFDGEVKSLAAGLETLKTSNPDGVTETAKYLERKMAVYQNQLRKAAATLPPTVLASVATSRDLVDDVTIKAIAVIVEKHLAGSTDAPRAVVVTKFEERIQQAEATLDATPAATDAAKADKVTKAKAAIAEAKQLLKDEDYQAALTKIEDVAQLTKEVEDVNADAAAPTEGAAPVTGDGADTSTAPKAGTTTDTNVNSASGAAAPTGSPETSGDAAGSGNR